MSPELGFAVRIDVVKKIKQLKKKKRYEQKCGAGKKETEDVCACTDRRNVVLCEICTLFSYYMNLKCKEQVFILVENNNFLQLLDLSAVYLYCNKYHLNLTSCQRLINTDNLPRPSIVSYVHFVTCIK